MHHQAVHDPYANRPVSVERLGHRGFWKLHGIDLLAEAERIAEASPKASEIRRIRQEREAA
jgi:hypothetical protein